jgi:pimeloyl-ACP methyl ester carboxylesterase
MVTFIVLAVASLIAAGGLVDFRSSFVLRVLNLGLPLPRHRAALAAMCSVPAEMPTELAAPFPIHMTTWGSTGPTVLLIHGGVQGGLGGGPATFREQEALAQRGLQLRVADRPGFGQTPTRGPDDIEADAVWASAELGDGAHLIGHSFGGAVALLAAARRPSAVRSLILIEPALIPLLPGSRAMRANRVARSDFLRMGEAWLSAQTPAEYGLTLARDLGVLSRGTSDGKVRGLDQQSAYELGCALLRARLASAGAMRKAAHAVAKAGIPVLIVSGGWSPTFDALGEVSAEITGGRHVTVQSPNHFVQLIASEAFNETAANFIQMAEHADVGPRATPWKAANCASTASRDSLVDI